MIEFRQGFRSMPAPRRELEKLIVSRKLAHGGNPGHPVDGIQRRRRPESGRQPQAGKDKSTERIDGIVALIRAIGRAMLPQEPGSPPSTRPRTCCSSDPSGRPV